MALWRAAVDVVAANDYECSCTCAGCEGRNMSFVQHCRSCRRNHDSAIKAAKQAADLADKRKNPPDLYLVCEEEELPF